MQVLLQCLILNIYLLLGCNRKQITGILLTPAPVTIYYCVAKMRFPFFPDRRIITFSADDDGGGTGSVVKTNKLIFPKRVEHNPSHARADGRTFRARGKDGFSVGLRDEGFRRIDHRYDHRSHSAHEQR